MKSFLSYLKTKSIPWWGVVMTFFGVVIALVTWLWPKPIYNKVPNFEVNFLNLPNDGDAAYYVTNPLISTGGDLSAFNNLLLSPLSVEVVPHYWGDQKYGNLVLRVSGINGTKDFSLWADFDKSAQTQTVKIDLVDIIKISGIKRNSDYDNTNLMIGDQPFQQTSLKFAVIRLSDPAKPFDSPKDLPIKNTPWKQEVSIVSRNGWFVDYAVTNLGEDAIFHCRITIVRTLSDVTESGHSFWSGTDEEAAIYPHCPSFKLGAGKTYITSFPLDKDTLGGELMHGRYLVQVYTFEERMDISIPPASNYDDANNMWIISNAGNVGTFVVCNDPGKSCQQTVTLPVEEETIRVYSYTSKDEFDNGVAYFVVRTYPVNNRSTNQYILDYWIDPQKTGWVGFGIWFENLVDVSAFNSIRFKLRLDPSKHPIYLDIKGKIGDTYKTSRVEFGKGEYGEPKSEEQTVVIPFSAFNGIDWTKVDTLYFGMDSFMVPDAAKHEIQVSEIEFIH